MHYIIMGLVKTNHFFLIESLIEPETDFFLQFLPIFWAQISIKGC